MISIIHPSRGRPIKSNETIRKWYKSAACDFKRESELIVSCDADDLYINTYIKTYGDRVIVNNNKSAIDAINNAAKVAQGDIFIVVSDDTECPDNWYDYLMIAIGDRKDFILKTQDGLQKWIITMPIMDRTYYNRFGYIYYPEYKHMFCDTELTMVADLTGRKITTDLLFPHKQYSVTGEKPDEVNKRADLTWNQGEKLFLERLKTNFGLKAEEIKGKVTDKSYINWARSKGVRI